jgi:threonine dehydrogenase-like Zn-dependent dehydrogenase
MKALCWCGTNQIHCEEVQRPRVINPRDAVVRITLTAICDSDLHLMDGFIPTMQ